MVKHLRKDKKTKLKLLKIELDPLKIEEYGLNISNVMNILCNCMEKYGLTKDENEIINNNIMFYMNDSDKGMANIMLAIDELSKIEWFKAVCLKLDYWEQNNDSIILYGEGMITNL